MHSKGTANHKELEHGFYMSFRDTNGLTIDDTIWSATTWEDRIAWAVAVSCAVALAESVVAMGTECKYLLVSDMA
jgi:hypothetical protein